MRWLLRITLGLMVWFAIGDRDVDIRAQGSPVLTGDRVLSIAATTPASLAQWTTATNQMMATGALALRFAQNDRAIAGRRHQTLQQVYRGVPVEGGTVMRQFSGATTVSIFGTIHTDIDLDPTPALSRDDAIRVVERESQRNLAAGSVFRLAIWPTGTGRYALIYRGTTADAVTYFVDARTGEVLRRFSEVRDAVGSGTGVLGDVKKISTTQNSGTFQTLDTLRPATVSTYDTRSNNATRDRLVALGVAFDTDFATDADNTWSDARVVDAHVHTGWTLDYFFKRHQWSGLDGQNRPVSTIVHRNLTNNATFTPPPFGPGRNGAITFGDTTAGLPVSSLDIAGHELMHGVTHFSLLRRTGEGLLDALNVEGLGTTSFTLNGEVFSCNSSVVITGNVSRPFLCSEGRYVIGSNQAGALNEAFSDVFGTSVELFYHPRGEGLLRGDYALGEDVEGFGPIRSLSNPGAIHAAGDTGPLPFPDHFSRHLSYALVLLQGTQANPIVVDFAPLAFVNGSPIPMFKTGSDFGGVHFNATVLGHAFYLAVEGGRNGTSGVTVSGVGDANRALIERAFFRAMTELLPNSPSMATAAQAIYQSSVDLYGASSAPANAIRQALMAVGF